MIKKILMLCAKICPIVAWGMMYLYYMAAFGGLPYIGNTTQKNVLCWFVILGTISFFGLYASILLTYQCKTKYLVIVLLALNMICFAISGIAIVSLTIQMMLGWK